MTQVIGAPLVIHEVQQRGQLVQVRDEPAIVRHRSRRRSARHERGRSRVPCGGRPDRLGETTRDTWLGMESLVRAAREWPLAARLIPLLLLGELVLCSLIIRFVRYTPIDWRAYMQEVEGPVVHGVWNYSELRGETGPLVYPGGFVAVYAGMRLLAGGDGSDVRPVQWLMAACYVATLGAVALCHTATKPRGMPPWSLMLVCVSLRLHSIYVLRLFNDAMAMLAFWVATYLFCRGNWRSGCVCYSLGASVKANVLLSAPGLLLLLLQAHGAFGAIFHILVCAAVQLVLGWPFLLTDPLAYVRGALGGFGDLQHKWSVNWKFVPAHVFHSRAFAATLALCHLLCLFGLATRVWTARQGGLRNALRGKLLRDTTTPVAQLQARALHPEHVLSTLVSCNCVGLLFARSIHFQFYCWYLHGVPLLLWRCTSLPLPLKLITFALLEYAYSYGLERVEGTSTPVSSACLQIAHVALLYAVWRAEPPLTYADERDQNQTTNKRDGTKER